MERLTGGEDGIRVSCTHTVSCCGAKFLYQKLDLQLRERVGNDFSADVFVTCVDFDEIA
jgi:hypothetical protein